jgi:hypothetical protein
MHDKARVRNEKDMKHIFAGLKIIGPFALLLAGFCSCASTEAQESSAEKEREAWYSNYVDNIGWSTGMYGEPVNYGQVFNSGGQTGGASPASTEPQ